MSCNVEIQLLRNLEVDYPLTSAVHGGGRRIRTVLESANIREFTVPVADFLKVDFYAHVSSVEVHQKHYGEHVEVHINVNTDLYAENLLSNLQDGLRILIDECDYVNYALYIRYHE